ncbi:MAG: MFS transporter [Acidothermus sp.]|nr:MFS transporter [Acidothermus sp.]
MTTPRGPRCDDEAGDAGPDAARRPRSDHPLRYNRNFRRLWIGETVSQLGTQISVVAVPLAAVTTLHANAFQVGLLTAIETAAFAVLGLPAGAWCDRWRRRPVLVAADLVRAVALGTVPVAAGAGVLSYAQLCAVVAVVGVATVFFDVDYQSFLPNLVGREHLVAANGALEASRSAAALAGPSIGGFLVQAFTAPYAIAADAVSFVWSGGWISLIDAADPRPVRDPTSSVAREIAEGLRFVFTHRVLRMLAGSTGTFNFFSGIYNAVVVVFLVRVIHLDSGVVGALFSAAGIGGLLGALVANRVRTAVGGPASIIFSAVSLAVLAPLAPLTAEGWRIGLFIVWSLLGAVAISVYNIATVSYRQEICPQPLLGRMNATMRFVVWGTLPLGGLLGGLLGQTLGLRAALWVAAAGTIASPLWVLVSPLARPGRTR